MSQHLVENSGSISQTGRIQDRPNSSLPSSGVAKAGAEAPPQSPGQVSLQETSNQWINQGG